MNCCSCNDIVGNRFHPTDKELIDHYLWNKTFDRDSAVQVIGEVPGNLCDWEPEELSRFVGRRSNDPTWYFFSRRNHSKRVKRTTKLGYWKLTGKHRRIKADMGSGAVKKTLVFYEGRVPNGKRTPWVIHEYTLPDTIPNPNGIFLCKLKKKDDEKADVSSGQEGQPSNVADDQIFDNLSEINVEELLAQLGETNGSNEVEDEVASAQRPQMYGEHVPSCGAASFLYNPNDFDGVQNQSSTNEQNDELHLVSSTLQPHMHKEHVPCNDFSFVWNNEIQHQSSTNEQDDEIQHQPSTIEQDDEIQLQPNTNGFSFCCGSNGNFHKIQHQFSTNEQDDGIQHQPSINEQDDGIQHQPSINEQDDGIQHQPSTNEQDDYFDEILELYFSQR